MGEDQVTAPARTISVTAGDTWRNVAYHAVIPTGIMVFLVYVMPKFMQIFEEMNIALPAATQLVLSLSHTVSHHAWLVLLMLGPVVLLDILIFLSLARYGGKGSARIWTWAVVILQFAFFLMLAVAVYLPLRGLRTQ